ncbi:MAG: amidohydrolase family protein, partial [bacterium]|nr:amidohydrolase family protein [bacterium]
MNKWTKLGALTISLVLILGAPAIAEDMEAPSQVLIKNVNVWDGTSDGLQNGMNVLIEGNLVKEISSGASAGPGATVIDGGGRTLMPGLIDMHSHLCIRDGMTFFRDAYDQMAAGANTAHALLEYLDQGFTTARDTGCNILGIA